MDKFLIHAIRPSVVTPLRVLQQTSSEAISQTHVPKEPAFIEFISICLFAGVDCL